MYIRFGVQCRGICTYIIYYCELEHSWYRLNPITCVMSTVCLDNSQLETSSQTAKTSIACMFLPSWNPLSCMGLQQIVLCSAVSFLVFFTACFSGGTLLVPSEALFPEAIVGSMPVLRIQMALHLSHGSIYSWSILIPRHWNFAIVILHRTDFMP